MKLLIAAAAALALALPGAAPSRVQFVFTSDAHYGITRASFRGARDVDAHIVNAAMVAAINSLPAASFPTDGGLGSAEPVGGVDFVAQGGDIANRAELLEQGPIQSASESWAQFTHDYVDGVILQNPAGRRADLYVVPGNHDASNAVGFHREMMPAVDPSSMVGIYNLMMRPPIPKTTFRYATDRVNYSRDVGGLHLVFLNVWADSQERAWMTRDLRHVSATTPVIILTHDQPDAEAKHFINPNGLHDLNETDRFENLLSDTFQDGPTIEAPSTIEQGALEVFLRSHPNIVAWFHGNSNWNQFYDWTGPNHTIALHVFRADSPMKGALSSADETRLSFQVATVDMSSWTMTVRECLWNADPRAIAWGGSVTVAIRPPSVRRTPETK